MNLSHWPVQSEHFPKTQVKMQYDDECLYVLFHVQDKYVSAATSCINGDVWKDSCVELFFAPSSNSPGDYFNLEINCCGVMLMQHHTGPRKNTRFIEIEDCQKIDIASSASGPIRHEISKPISWTLEYSMPFEILSKYADIDKPASGVAWRGNFYKCADDSSHPHWMAWSQIDLPDPDFHRPEYFGNLIFTS